MCDRVCFLKIDFFKITRIILALFRIYLYKSYSKLAKILVFEAIWNVDISNRLLQVWTNVCHQIYSS